MPLALTYDKDFHPDSFKTRKEIMSSMNGAPVFLLVEPSPILRSSLQDWLGQALAGHRILTAANGMEALRVAGQERPSHILIEMELPDIPGWEVLGQIRQALPELSQRDGMTVASFSRESGLREQVDSFASISCPANCLHYGK